jgi:hypothetical protein
MTEGVMLESWERSWRLECWDDEDRIDVRYGTRKSLTRFAKSFTRGYTMYRYGARKRCDVIRTYTRP